MSFFFLTGILCSERLSFDSANMIFAAYFIPRGRDTQIDFLRLLFLVSEIWPLMQTKPETLLVGSESEIKTQNFPETITMATSGNARVKASTPSEVAELFNQYFASVFCVCSGNSSAWKGEWSVTGLRPVLDWCNSLSIWSCYWTRLFTCKNFERNNWRNSTLAHRIVQQVAEVGLSARGLETCKHRSCFQKI